MNINLRPTLYKDLTVGEAVAQGYTQYCYTDYNHSEPHPLEEATTCLEQGREIYLLEKNLEHIVIEEDDLREIIARTLLEKFYNSCGVDIDDLYEALYGVDYEDTVEKINESIKGLGICKTTDIKLVLNKN